MDWFRKLFFKKQTAEQIKKWIQEELEKLEKEQQQAVEEGQQALPELLNNAKQAILETEQAELRNPNISERAKHFMQGNREQFSKLTHRFLENVFMPKDATDISQIDLQFHQYAQNIARPAAILTEFLGEEVKKTRSALAEIEAKILQIKKIETKKEELRKISDTIQEIENTKTETERIEKQQEEFKEKLQQLTAKREALRKEKEQFINKPEYIKIKDEILLAARERLQSEQEITGMFFALSDAIKKYSHKTKNTKLAKYAEQPLQALIKDYSLGIIKHKEELAKSIKSGELELKPEKTQKALEALQKLTKDNLSAMIHRYAKAKKREADVQNDMAEKQTIKEYEQYAIDIKMTNQEIEQLEKTITKLAIPSDELLKMQLKKQLEKFKILLV